MVKNCLPRLETQETWVRSLDWEELLEEEMATHSSILAWKILWTEEHVILQSTGLESQTLLKTHVHVACVTTIIAHPQKKRILIQNLNNPRFLIFISKGLNQELDIIKEK